MKKLLLLILIALLLALSIFVVIQGLDVNSVKILSFSAIKQKNLELDEKIQDATKLATVNYKKSLQDLEEKSKALQKVKQNYEDLVNTTTDENLEIANQFEKYKYEKLLIDLGRHATSEGADLKIEVIGNGTPIKLSSTETIYLYDLNFTVTGSYVAITSVISNIENDTELGFKIEAFKMDPSSSTSVLQATFTCKNIPMSEQLPVISSGGSALTDNATTGNNTNSNTNTSNTTNNTTNSNARNSGNTTNSSKNTSNTTD